MTLHLYDTAQRRVRPFEPLVDGQVSIYQCGATVQGNPHIGHLRTGLVYDVLQRWLEHAGHQVTHVRNVTDIDDKILAKADEAGRAWWDWAAEHERAFTAGYDALGVKRPTIEPRATGHIPQMHAMIGELIDAGKAYAADGDVYFAVRSQPDYGYLSGQKLDELQQGESWAGAKRDPVDFTLWKAAKPGEPYWDSPWGPGRPGWHLECSAMARTYLGDAFDVHGGAIDLIFPHHENESAQSHGVGLEFARYWMHPQWVTMAGEKMSKSLGNTLSIEAITEHTRPIALRYYLVSTHYRSPIEYSRGALDDAAKAFGRIESFLRRAAAVHGPIQIGALPDAFVAAMDDDLGVPKALAVLHDQLRAGNTALEAGNADAARIAGEIRGMLAVLGLDPWAAPWASSATDAAADTLRGAVDSLVRGLLEQRAAARASKDFAAADAIRDQLAGAGITITDTADGPTWSVAAKE